LSNQHFVIGRPAGLAADRRRLNAGLFEIPATLLPVSLSGQSLFDPFPFARLQVEGVLLHFLDDVLLLDFPLEPAEGVL